MSEFNFYPLVGMNTVAPDGDMDKKDNRTRKFFARDLVNGVVDSAGKWAARPGSALATTARLENLWWSERFDDTFAVVDGMLVLVNVDWSTTDLGHVGEGADYLELNNEVVICASAGLFSYGARGLLRFTLNDPPAPRATAVSGGGLAAGTYSVAVSYRVGSKESAVSETVQVEVPENGQIEMVLPMAALLEPNATHISVYASSANGGEVYEVLCLPATAVNASVTRASTSGKPAVNRWLTAMPAGKTIRFWRGRLITPGANVLYFSEALNYHLHDPRHGFIQLATRITFVEPVDGGIWVGQADHVVFLKGEDLNTLTVDYKNVRAPVPWSSTLINSELLSKSLDNTSTSACWLAANGYVVGTSDGVPHEMSAGVLDGITGASGQTVAHGRRFVTITH